MLDIKADKVYKQELHDNAIGHQEVQNLYQENNEKSEKIEFLYESRIKDKDAIIEQLQKIIEKIN